MDIDEREIVKIGNPNSTPLDPDAALEKRLSKDQQNRQAFQEECERIRQSAEDNSPETRMDLFYSSMADLLGTARRPSAQGAQRPSAFFNWLSRLFLRLSGWAQRMSVQREKKAAAREEKAWKERVRRFTVLLEGCFDKVSEKDEFYEVMWKIEEGTEPRNLRLLPGETKLQAIRRVFEQHLKVYEESRKKAFQGLEFRLLDRGEEKEPSEIPEEVIGQTGSNGDPDRGKAEDPLLDELKEKKMQSLLAKESLTDEEKALLADLLEAKGDIVVVKEK